MVASAANQFPNANINGAPVGVTPQQAGASGTTLFNPSGVIYLNTTPGSNVGTAETTLASYSLPANSLNAISQGLYIYAWGGTATNGNNKTMKLYFGSEVITTPTAATSNKGWFLSLTVLTSSATAGQVVNGTGQVDVTPVTPYVAAGTESQTAAITIKCTGTSGTGSNDITLDGMYVEYLA
jgi:hypothetical protein